MKQRLVIIPIDNVLALLKDYAGLIAVPKDAQVERLLINPQERKKALEISTEDWTGLQVPEEIRFDLQRTFMVG